MLDVLLPDTSCLIFLEKLREIKLLKKLYEEVIITNEVNDEFKNPLPNWISIHQIHESNYLKVLEQSVDKGEASLILLALEKENCILAIDDLKARKLAKSLGLKVTGTLGIIFKGKQEGHIKSVKTCIKKLKKVDFRISANVEKELLRMAGE